VRREAGRLLAGEVRDRERVAVAVDQTACVMFPRSKRPVKNERWRRTASAPNPAAKAETARASARLNARAR
jgi:hypothetical protein